MTILEELTSYISNTTSTLAPLTLPLGPVGPLSRLIDHVTTTPVHSAYYPFLRFGAIHATRLTLVWAGMTKGRKTPVPVLQDLFGYLVLACELACVCGALIIGGGGTISSLLLSQPPSWLVDPTPWLIYPSIYFGLHQTGISTYIMSTAPTLINLFGSYIDGITRGTAISGLPIAIAKSGLSNNVWATALISGITVASGGWIIQALGIHESEWGVHRPAILSGGILDTLDLWSGILTGLLYGTLTKSHTELYPAAGVLARMLPNDMVLADTSKGLVPTNTARAICVLFLGSLLAARVITKFILESGSAGVSRRTKVKVSKKKSKSDKTEVVKQPVEVHVAETKIPPRKGKKGK